MFKLINDYNLDTLLKKVKMNAIAMFVVYAVFIVAGVVSWFFVSEKDSIWFIFIVVMSFGLLLVSPFLLFDYYTNKLDNYSIFILGRNIGAIDLLDDKIKKCETVGDRLGICEEYVFSMKSTFYIPFAIPTGDITAVYFKRSRSKRIGPYDVNLFVITNSGKLYKLPLGAKGGTRENQYIAKLIMSKVIVYIPNAFLGVQSLGMSTKSVDKLEPFNFN